MGVLILKHYEWIWGEYLLKEVGIEAAKGFVKRQPFGFAIPNNLPGSSLTIMIGQEKTGKVSVIQALRQIRPRGTRGSSAAKTDPKMQGRDLSER